MRRRWIALPFVVALSAGLCRSTAADATAPLYATASCTPASKPGRIRCRAVVELPLEASTSRRLAWGELRIVKADPDLEPLRGRLGPLDAETREDGRIAWTFSVASTKPGDRSMTVKLLATIEPRSGGTPTLFERELAVAVHVAAP
jgi:hypothetical protein